MTEAKNYTEAQTRYSKGIKKLENRKLEAKHGTIKALWFGFGAFGLIGWSVVLPTIGGTLLGIWLDEKIPEKFSWTLSLLFTGLFAGCLNAWHWIDKENKQIGEQQLNNNKK